MKKKLTLIVITLIFVISLCSTSFAGRTLSYGVNGDDVRALQQILAVFGYFHDEPTGFFGTQTQYALTALQFDLGLEADGVAGPVTNGYLGLTTYDDSYSAYDTSESYYTSYASFDDISLSGTLSKGMTGTDVYTLQELLAMYGYFLDTPSGYFGDMTEQAVLAFQSSFGLVADGVAGPQTIGALTGNYVDTTAASTQSSYYEEYAQKILDAISVTPSTSAGYCASWVTNVLRNAGLTSGVSYNANDYWANVCYSSDVNELMPGMVIATRNSYSYLGSIYGHVGFYIGNGQVISSIGYLETLGLDEWISRYNNSGMGSTARWGFF